VKSFFVGLELRRSEFQNFGVVDIAHQINILRNGVLGMSIRLSQVSPLGTVPENIFELRGHEWTRSFTDEVR
jgi:hypothetical protein